MPSHHDDFAFRQSFIGESQDFHSVDVVHHHVRDDDVERFSLDQGGRIGTAGCDFANVADLLQTLRHRSRVGSFIVDHQQTVLRTIRRFGGRIGGGSEIGSHSNQTDDEKG